MLIRPANAADGMLLKQVRMRALADAPYASGGPDSAASEQALPDAYWHQSARELAGDVAEWRERCVSYIVFDAGLACATGSGVVCNHPTSSLLQRRVGRPAVPPPGPWGAGSSGPSVSGRPLGGVTI
jgi:hypothetical protein